MHDEASAPTWHWMIYGANGYTGELCAREAVRRGMRPLLAGRNEAAVAGLADELGLHHRIFALDDEDTAARHVEGMAAVLLCAGPFSATARPMLEACRRSHAHYLDITGEVGAFEYVHQRNAQWRDAGMVALPGVGFDVVPTDCLAAMLKRDLPTATHLRLAFAALSGGMSPGTAKTIVEGMPQGAWVRQNGGLTRLPLASKTETFPFESGAAKAVLISWGDVSTAYYSTGIPNIEVYVTAPDKQVRTLRRIRPFLPLLGLAPLQWLLKRIIERTVQGPAQDVLESSHAELYGDVADGEGNRAARVMRTPEGYAHTVDASLTAVTRLLQDTVEPGAHTPATAFGPDYVLELKGVECRKTGAAPGIAPAAP